MIPKITRRSFAIGASAMAVTAAAGTLPAVAAVNSNAKKAYAYLYNKKGYAKHQSAGVVGNLIVESGVNPRSKQGGGGPGRGIAQWSVNERWRSLLKYAKDRGRDPYSLYLQLDFICYELDKYAYLGKKQLKDSKNVDEATRAFCDHFERPGIPHLDRRIAAAREVYNGKPGGGGPSGETDIPWLRQGNKGSAVRTMQYMMTARGYTLTTDGDFGPVTNRKVRQFQASRRLKVDGVVGPVTWRHLLYTLRQGSRGTSVKGLQRELNDAGAGLKVDGDFGSKTRGAAVTFQQRNGLPVDGIVGLMTWGGLID